METAGKPVRSSSGQFRSCFCTGVSLTGAEGRDDAAGAEDPEELEAPEEPEEPDDPEDHEEEEDDDGRDEDPGASSCAGGASGFSALLRCGGLYFTPRDRCRLSASGSTQRRSNRMALALALGP